MNKVLSASQIGKARGCLRKWGWQYLDGIKQPQTAANTTGIAIHKMQEDYLMKGTIPVPGTEAAELFRLALPFLPRPKIATVEERSNVVIGEIEYVTIPDAYLYDWETQTISLIDHKTSKHFPRFLLRKREQFLDDVQFLLYSRALLLRYLIATGVQATWIGYKVRDPNSDKKYTPKVYAEPQTFSRAEVLDAFARIVAPLATKLIQIHSKGLRAAQLPANVDHCTEYGGCYYLKQKICQPMESTMNVDDLFASFEKHTAPAKTVAQIVKEDKVNAPEAKLPAPPETAPAPGPAPAGYVDAVADTDPYAILNVLIGLGLRYEAFQTLRAMLKAAL